MAGGAGLMEDPVVSSVRPLTRSVCAVRKKELRHSLSTETSPWYMNSTMPCRSSYGTSFSTITGCCQDEMPWKQQYFYFSLKKSLNQIRSNIQIEAFHEFFIDFKIPIKNSSNQSITKWKRNKSKHFTSFYKDFQNFLTN